MNFLVVDRYAIVTGKRHVFIQEPFVLISISSPENREYEIVPATNMLDTLRIVFHDLDKDQDGNLKVKGSIVPVDKKNLKPFDSEMAQDIINFANKYEDKVNLIVIHCDAGLSRSPGVAMALHDTMNGKGEPKYFIQSQNGLFLYNRFVHRIILNVNSSLGSRSTHDIRE